MEHLTNYDWPGNVRELQNVIERAVVLAKGSVVTIDNSTLRSEEAPEQSSIDTLENVERNHILRALNQTRWVIHGKRAPPRFSASIRAPCARAWISSESGDPRIFSRRYLKTYSLPVDGNLEGASHCHLLCDWFHAIHLFRPIRFPVR